MFIIFVDRGKIYVIMKLICLYNKFYLLQILFNLANQYEANEMYGEALNSYNVIVKNKLFSSAG